MPIPMVLTSSDGFTGSQKYSRFGGPVYSGTVADNGVGGPLPAPGAVALIQSTAPLATQVIASTVGIARGSYVYIPQGTVGVSSSGGTTTPGGPAYTGIGAALYFDITRRKLSIFSTGVGEWLSVTLSSS